MTTFRFFAAARAAAGTAEATVDAGTLAEAVERIAERFEGAGADAAPGDAARWREIAGRCSFLLDGVTTRDLSASLAGVDVVDVMPPFAGG